MHEIDTYDETDGRTTDETRRNADAVTGRYSLACPVCELVLVTVHATVHGPVTVHGADLSCPGCRAGWHADELQRLDGGVYDA